MEITFLGTGTSGGVPLIGCQCNVCKSTDPRDKRLRTSILLKINGLTLVVDCGPDFRQQMLREDGFGKHSIYKVFIAEEVATGDVIGMALFYTAYSTWKGKIIYLDDLIVMMVCFLL